MRKIKIDDGQLEFDFEELKKQVELPYFENPKNENEQLLNYQYEYRINNNKNALSKMYILSLPIAGKFITDKVKTSRNLRNLSMEEREEKAHNAATYVVESFLLDEDFFIKKSFTGVIYLRVLHELFYKTKASVNISFVDDKTLNTILIEEYKKNINLD